MENRGKIGCSAGRVRILDPNDFNGVNSSENQPVPLEDLNISVVLTTYRKGRTILISEGDKNIVESNKTVSINFIEGANQGGKKSLTTKYTDLTAVGGDKQNEETLGITNIDIEFNASMAPLVTINFIDVRGSSIFQNEQNAINGENKYATLFQLPYPLFELEVKGYYGRPVKYCLHLTKFSSKFNASTGNFEITCNFIGHTYAMFSDLLIGYLKAIPFTKIGQERFDKYNETRTAAGGLPIIKLSDLSAIISDINTPLNRLAANDSVSTELNTIREGLNKIESIRASIVNLGSLISLEKDLDSYEYIIMVDNTVFPITKDKDSVASYIENVTTIIKEFNDLTYSDKFELNDFTILTNSKSTGARFYDSITKNDLNTTSSNNDEALKVSLGTPNDLLETKKKIYDFINSVYGDKINGAKKIDILDMSDLFKTLDSRKSTLETSEKQKSEELANKMKNVVNEKLGFESNVRNIIETFTAAAEIFMETIYSVSHSAEGNSIRHTELLQAFGEDKNTDQNKVNFDNKIFLPWPEYRKKDDVKGTYIDTYLGDRNVLRTPSNVDELVFIDDLLKAFHKAKQVEDESNSALDSESESTSWYPVNALDTTLFTSIEPYSRDGIKTKEDIVRLLLIRAMTFLSYSNIDKSLKPEEIEKMAHLESEAIIRVVKDDVIRQSLSKLEIKSILDSKGTIDDISEKIVELKIALSGEKNYLYEYIVSDSVYNVTILPINKGFNNFIWSESGNDSKSTDNYPKLRDLRDDEDYIFTSNFLTEIAEYNLDDGSTFIKILNISDIPNKPTLINQVEIDSTNLISLNGLTSSDYLKSSGFNQFGGDYGIQEFKHMDWGEEDLKGLPLMYVFYGDKTSSGLALSRASSGEQLFGEGKSTSSRFDLNDDKIVISSKINEQYTMLDDNKIHANIGENRILMNYLINGDSKEITYPYIEQRISHSILSSDASFSLFGSLFYYQQSYAKCFDKNNKVLIDCSEYSKAMTFLQTMPFNYIENNEDPFFQNSINRLFNTKSGLIHAPRLWCAWIGSILWRKDKSPPIVKGKKIVGGGSGKGDPIVWGYYFNNGKIVKNDSTSWTNFSVPDLYEYFPSILNSAIYRDIEPNQLVSRLPMQIKKQFKKIFFDFVNGDDSKISFNNIKSNLEIWNGDGESFRLHMNKLKSNIINTNGKETITKSELIDDNNFKIDNIKYYNIINPLISNNNEYNLFLELKGNYKSNIAVKTLIDSMREEVIIVNSSPYIWGGSNYQEYSLASNPNTDIYRTKAISVEPKILEDYLNKIIDKLKVDADALSPNKKEKQDNQEIFGTTNKDVIKLQLYRHCKTIYDKWLGGSESIDKTIFQCGGRNNVDSKLAEQHKNTKTRLIDSFRFVNRAFRDIGTELYINPVPINNYLTNDANMSLYNSISSLLAANNFEFNALPNFINFNDEENLKSMFTPYSTYADAIRDGSCGPSFVAVYIGQGSKHLDFTRANYPNDGFDLRCDGKGVSTEAPLDFTSQEVKGYEDPISTFVVRYGQQNQNIFKDVKLDQSEFSETDESLQIQDEISQLGAENNRGIIGQNIYNTYAVRSYTADIEMMGNAMIQPMMFFQLDNIPMFHGAYLIKSVSHSIKPNYMSTSFKGTRIRYPETPLITSTDIYMDLLETMDTSNAGIGKIRATIGKLAPIMMTIYENGGSNGNIVSGNIKTKSIPKIDGVWNIKLNNPKEGFMLENAVEPLTKMLTEFVAWLKTEGFQGDTNGYYTYITSVYRDFDKQFALKAEMIAAGTPKKAATPGSSAHGWGIAFDIQFLTKGTETPKKYSVTIRNKEDVAESFKLATNPAIKWMYDNSYRYGFVLPAILRDGQSLDEHWHFEYHGTSAICLIKQNPTVYGYTINTDKKQDDSVTNPKTMKGEPAVYSDTDCTYKVVKDTGDGTEAKSTKLKGDAKAVQVKVMNLLKADNLNKEQVAGVMGNIHQESTFNPLAENKKDRNGYRSVGLIQWNGASYDLAAVGNSVESQMKFLVNMNNYKTWKNLPEKKLTKKWANSAAFEFANLVEICHLCNQGYQTYYTSYQNKRSSYALDYFERFNNPDDDLYWVN